MAQESQAYKVRPSDSFGGRLFFPPRAAGVLGPPATDWERREGEAGEEEREREKERSSKPVTAVGRETVREIVMVGESERRELGGEVREVVQTGERREWVVKPGVS